ncbi:MAG TPA: amidohydrolase, partial [Bacteroidia bacterium]|nr:amidohydrolase [Bacteroidia bacterium]
PCPPKLQRRRISLVRRSFSVGGLLLPRPPKLQRRRISLVRRSFSVGGFLLLFLNSCGDGKMHADLIVKNAKVYTVDGGFAVLESFAIRDGKFVAVGTDSSISYLYEADSVYDAGGKIILPGFIDAHCHFLGYGLGLQQCNLVGTRSFDEVINRVKEFAKTAKSGWIVGRGWDQNDWTDKTFPDRRRLDSMFPDRPVILKRIDGHAALVNGAALKRSNIHYDTKITGGEILVRREKNAPVESDESLTGILIDNAVEQVEKVIPPPSAAQMREALLTAQANCFAVGLTTVTDAGLMKDQIETIDALQKKGDLQMRVYAMLTDSLPNYKHYVAAGPYKTDYLNVRSFKFYADGALGSRGACLLENYSDQPGWKGFLLNTPKHFEEKMTLLAQKNFQVCTHAIGDSANRFILNLYAKILPDSISKDRRWRIEHAQVVAEEDVMLFGRSGIIPSVQPTHATSDMYWAEKRLGPERARTAYAYKFLLGSAGMVALGTDFPVESINPMHTFYATVARMDLRQFPPGGFQMENALSRWEALRGMTIWAAFANFEENEKGSIEAGKFADFIILDKDPLACPVNEIPGILVLSTYVAGKNVFVKK